MLLFSPPQHYTIFQLQVGDELLHLCHCIRVRHRVVSRIICCKLSRSKFLVEWMFIGILRQSSHHHGS